MAGLTHRRGPSIARLRDTVRGLPLTVAAEVAKRAAPEITAAALASYDQGATAYGDARPLGVNGNPLSLVRKGRTRAGLRFAVEGTRIRCVLPENYDRYLIGKYWILPSVHSLPAPWSARLSAIVQRVGDAETSRGAA